MGVHRGSAGGPQGVRRGSTGSGLAEPVVGSREEDEGPQRVRRGPQGVYRGSTGGPQGVHSGLAEEGDYLGRLDGAVVARVDDVAAHARLEDAVEQLLVLAAAFHVGARDRLAAPHQHGLCVAKEEAKKKKETTSDAFNPPVDRFLRGQTDSGVVAVGEDGEASAGAEGGGGHQDVVVDAARHHDGRRIRRTHGELLVDVRQAPVVVRLHQLRKLDFRPEGRPAVLQRRRGRLVEERVEQRLVL